MVEVIKHGTKRQPKYQTACYFCNCVFQFNDSDLHSYAGITDNVYVTCPECQTWNRKEYAKVLAEKEKNNV